MISQELLVLVVIVVAALIVTLFIIKRLLKLLYYIIIALMSFLPGYYFGEYISVHLEGLISNPLLLNIISFCISFLSFYIVLIFFIGLFTKGKK